MDDRTIGDFENNNKLNIVKVIEYYNAYIYTIIKNSMSNKEDIEEVLSDVFIVLWNNYEKLDSSMKIKPYLIGIVKNLIKKKYRMSAIQKELDNIEDYENEIGDYIDIQSLAEKNEKSKIVQEVLQSMEELQRQIFIMFYYKSRKIKEISKELKISESKTKIVLHRLRKTVKKKIKEGGYDYGK